MISVQSSADVTYFLTHCSILSPLGDVYNYQYQHGASDMRLDVINEAQHVHCCQITISAACC